MKEFIAIMIILSIILLFLVFALMIIGILIEMIKEIKQWTKRKLVNNMKECTVFVINKKTGKLVDEFVTDYVNDKQLEEFMSDEIHNYDISYNNLLYFYQF